MKSVTRAIQLPNLLLLKLAYSLLRIVGANNDLDTSPGSNSNYTPPRFWTEHWEGHSANLSLVFSDGHIAFYFDQPASECSKYLHTWPLKFISDAWRYAKIKYGPLSSDPILYIVIHKEHQECMVSKLNSYFEEEFDNQSVMDCGQNIFEDRMRTGDANEFDMANVLSSIAIIVLRVAKNTGNWPAYEVSQWRMSEILVYDMALGLGISSFAAMWQNSKMSEKRNYTQPDTYWFRDWFYPIYINFGGSKVLNNFLTILNENLPQIENDYVRELTMGEFIHFWSGAAGEDLSVLAAPAFKWKRSKYNLTLFEAKENFPNITYADGPTPSEWQKPKNVISEYWNDHTAELNLVFTDHHTVFYYDEDMNRSISWPFKFLSNAWRFAKEIYGPLSSDPILYVVLHAKKYENCAPLWRLHDSDYGFDNLIDCGPTYEPNYNYDSNSSWVDSAFNTYVLAREISHIILREAIQKYIWRDEDGTAPLQDMITLDILSSMGWNDVEMRWVKKRLKSRSFFRHLNGEAFTLRSWYLHIYENFGGARVVRNYFRLIHSDWPGPLRVSSKMQLDEIVHFWSAAAGVNLWHSASKAFQWTMQDHIRFFKAQSDFSMHNYSNTFPETKMTIPLLKWKEHGTYDDDGIHPHDEELTLVYVDFYVAFYFDSHVDKSIYWPFKIISDSWSYAHKYYGPFGADPMLYVIFHESAYRSWFQGSRENSFSDSDYENRTVIDGGLATGEWKKTKYLDQLMGQVAQRIIRGAKAIGNWPLKAIDSSNSLRNILMFDIYMGIGLTNFAVRHHKRVYNRDEWFTNWHYKIYAKYGRISVLSRLFSLLHSYWPKSVNGYDYAGQLNAGEFVHFWSGAAGVNLTFMIPEQLEWNRKKEMEYRNATIDYPMITYRVWTNKDADITPLRLTENWLEHSEYLFLAYRDSFVVTYFDADVPPNITWPFNLLSRSWSYLQKSYDLIPQTSHASLHIVLHAKRHNLCRTLWNTPSKSNNVTNIIDCGRSSSESWMTESAGNVDYLMQEFGHIVQQSANQTDEKENYVSSLTDVMVFDIYLSTGRVEDAFRWLVMKIIEKEKQSAGEIYWIRDWYIPIYTNHGGVSVLNSYSELVLSHGSIKKDNGTKLSIGHILHFWSAAAGENLLRFASTVFSWTERYQEQFDDARKHQPKLNYTDYNYSFEESREQNSILVWMLTVSGVAVFTVVLILFLLHRRRIKLLQDQIRDLSFDELVEFFEGIANPTNTDGNGLSESRPFNMDFEIPRDRLDIYHDHVLGSGEFGLVFRGSITTAVDDGIRITTVAVKTVKSNANVFLFKSLLAELKILCYLDNKDENVARLMGAVTVNIKQRELLIALEFCEQGDLLSYLRQNRSNFRDLFHKQVCVTSFIETNTLTAAPDNDTQPQASSSNSKIETNPTNHVSTLDLLEWARQISSGMTFISSQNIIHGDLAARNVLLTKEGVAKISDFGLSRQLANYSCYTKKSKTPLPWKWLAIESLLDKHFSIQSDVWAFGVTLFEIFTLGQTPYPGCKWNQDFMHRLVAGERVQSPMFGNEQVYGLMMDCMKKKPEERISFEDATKTFQSLKANLRPNSESELDSFCIYSVLEC